MINELSIKNFKILRDLKIPKLSPVTLIAGKNNVGKSTVLEAIFFSTSNIPLLTEKRLFSGMVNRAFSREDRRLQP